MSEEDPLPPLLTDVEYWLLLPPAGFVVFLVAYYINWLSWELFINN